MKNKIFILLVYSFVFLLIFFTLFINKRGNEQKKKLNFQKLTFFSMDTIVEVIYEGEKGIKSKIIDEFERLSNKYSPSNKTSIVYKINNRNGKKVIVDDETDFLLSKSIEIAKATNGRFDITVEPLVSAYGFYDKRYRVPKNEELKKLLKTVSYKFIKRTKKRVYYFKDGVKIDLGGIAKGYAVDRVGEILNKLKIKNYLINAGGEIKVSGHNPKGIPWKIGIRSPRGKKISKVLSLKSSAIATSGDYERFFIFNGKRYYHIISPFTGLPWENGWKSITVVSKTCMVSDALSTAFFGFKRSELLKSISLTSKKFNVFFVYGIDRSKIPFEFKTKSFNP